MTKPVVLMTEGSTDPSAVDWLRDHSELLEAGTDDPRFPAYLSRAQGLLVRTYTRVNEKLLAGAPRLRAVARAGVGLDNIDIPACRGRGIEVVYTPDANSQAVADYVFAILLQIIRPLTIFRDKAFAPAEFKRVRDGIQGGQLDQLTMGILGMGRVGRHVGRAAVAFGMKVTYNDLLDVQSQLDFPATPVDKETLYRQCDVLTIHVDMKKGNENLVGEKQIAMLKPTAILINASRGEVLDAHALARAMKAGHLRAAALDVYAPEPPPADFPLLGMDNVILTPHLASRTSPAVSNMSWVVKDLVGVLNGERPRFPAP